MKDPAFSTGSFESPIRLLVFAGVTSPRLDPFTAARTVTSVYELNAGPVASVAAFLTAGLTVIHRVLVDVVFRTFARRVAGVAPFIYSVEARAVVFSAVGTAVLFEIENICVGFGSVTVMPGSSAVIRFGLITD